MPRKKIGEAKLFFGNNVILSFLLFVYLSLQSILTFKHNDREEANPLLKISTKVALSV
jgi:hypothetical protein